jgi:hydroxymethylbilane synthase
MRLGTRASALALAQANLVAHLLAADTGHSAGEIEIVPLTTTGDRPAGAPARGADASNGNSGGGGSSTSKTEAPARARVRARGAADKSRWVDAIERALLAGEIDLAVHSAKDLPGESTEGLELLGGPARAPAGDVLCGAPELDALPRGARVGTSSLRRTAQLRAVRADLDVVGLAGNVDTRLRKLSDTRGTLDAIVLARAGLVRLGREGELGAELDPARFVPAPGQGMLALQARAGDTSVREAVTGILDGESSACLLAERALARALAADCHTPLGAHAAPAGCGCLRLRAWVGLPDGSAWVADELLGGFYDPDALGARVAERMLVAGAGEILTRASEMVGAS